jgi:hypothetical protein
MKSAMLMGLLLSLSNVAVAADLNYINDPQMESIGIKEKNVQNDLTFAQIDRQNPLVRLNAPANVRALLTRVQNANANVDLKKIHGAYYCRALTNAMTDNSLSDFMDCSIKDFSGTIMLNKDSGSLLFGAEIVKVPGLTPAIFKLTSSNNDMGSNGVVYADEKELYIVIKEGATNRIVELVPRK